MTDNELLLSISNIMDKKLEPLEKRMDAFDEKLDRVEERLSAEITCLDVKIDHVERKLTSEINRLDSKIDNVEQKVVAVEQDLKAVRQDLKDDIHLINLKLENMIIPRLNEIESCYLSTSERYMRETDKFVAFETDLSAMRSVVIEHGNRLSAISA